MYSFVNPLEAAVLAFVELAKAASAVIFIAATVEESTPPDIATTTKVSFGFPEKMFTCASVYTSFNEGEYYFFIDNN